LHQQRHKQQPKQKLVRTVFFFLNETKLLKIINNRHFMKKQLLFVFCAALIAITGCKKDKDENGSTDGGPVASKLVKRIIETEDGVTTTFNITYDGSKRITSYKSTDNKEITNFTYDGSGNVTKVENIDEESKNVFEFTYNNGRPVSGEFKSYEMIGGQQGELAASYRLDYTVTNGLVTEMKMHMEGEEDEDDIEINYALTYENGNLKKVQSTGLGATTITYTYGNKKPIFPATFKYVLDQAGFSTQFFAKNDILTTTYDFPGSTMDATVTNTYTYDSNGYVLTSNDGDTQVKFEY
jgi:YD repeat-containing protein